MCVLLELMPQAQCEGGKFARWLSRLFFQVNISKKTTKYRIRQG